METIEGKATILIVDDISANIDMLSELLKDDYDIRVAKNGKKALEIIRKKNKIDLILLDVVMPDIDGYEVCKALKNDPSTQDIPIIFVTGNDSPVDEELGLNLGAVDYIKKPFHPKIVKIRVRNHIKLKLKSDMLEELSMCDSLTHVPNRRNFDESFKTKYRESLRDKVSLAVMMIDIDYFKPYNDNYGHGMGDETLIKVALALKNILKRPSDMVARYGGEEFVVILKDINTDGVKKVASSLIKVVENLKIPHNYSQVSKYLTVSIGASLKEVESDKSKETLLKEADEALYIAKKAGRNQYFIKNRASNF